jgi:putative spermidine/putrescine transport system permease protein
LPDITILPPMMFTASLPEGYQIAVITALILLVPSIAFLLLTEPVPEHEDACQNRLIRS